MFYFSDNPVLDALRYDNDMEDITAQYRKCSCCGAPIYPGEEYYHVEGQDFCPVCIRDMRKTEQIL